MRLTFLGTCSGTEPMPGRCHVSWVLNSGKGLYWFDAGESCARNGYLSGMDVLDIKAIFISHAHMDHVGGLPELLWTIQKVDGIKRHPLKGALVELYTPNIVSWNGTLDMLQNAEHGFQTSFEMRVHEVTEGVVRDDGVVRVEAITNNHLTDGRSKSYRIFCGGRCIVYSGDVGSITDMECWFNGSADVDLLLMETGHHKVTDVCKYVANHLAIKRLAFIHHGREILEHCAEMRVVAESILGNRVLITDDGDIMDL